MDVMTLTARLGLDSSAYEKGLKNAEGGMKSLMGTFKKVAAGLAIGATITKSVKAIVDLTKSAVSAYGEYEQLVGGVNKLYGRDEEAMKKYADTVYEVGQRGKEVKELQEALIKQGYDISADGIYGPKTKAAFEAYKKGAGDVVAANQKIVDNAWEAYNTVGMSANQYMSSVTGFSAALIKSLKGDTDKAADYADMAMRDIADNANTFGKYTIDELTGVYQALARGNFQTLDNLQLGYAGTKQGMQDLIKEANRLKAANGETANLSIDSYADMVEAIHLVQESMHITGTTEREAAGTIQGSINATKAAWQNLLIAFGRGQDMRKAMKNLTASAKNVIKNIVPVVKNALEGIGDFIGELGPVIIEELPGLIQTLLPSLLSAVGKLILSLGRALPQLMKSLLYGIHVSFREFNKWLSGQNKQLGQAFTNLRIPFIKAFHGISKYWEGTAKPALQGAWKYITGTFIPDIKGAIDNATGENGIDWSKLWQGLSEIDLVDKLKTLFAAVPGKISELLGSAAEFLEGGTFAGFADTFYGIIEQAFKAGSGGNLASIASAISGLFTAENFSNLITISGDFGSVIINALSAAIVGTVEGITSLTEAAGGLINKGLDALTSDEFAASAETAIGKFWDAIVSAIGNIGDAATRLATAVRTVLTNALTHENISKLFGENGIVKNLAGRVINGIANAISTVSDAAGKIADEIAGLIQDIDWEALGYDFSATATGLINQIFDGLSETDFSGIAGKIGTLLGSALKAAAEAKAGISNALIDWIISGDVFVALAHGATSIAGFFGEMFFAAIGEALNIHDLGEQFKGVWDAVQDFIFGGEHTEELNISLGKFNFGDDEYGIAQELIRRINQGMQEAAASGEEFDLGAVMDQWKTEFNWEEYKDKYTGDFDELFAAIEEYVDGYDWGDLETSPEITSTPTLTTDPTDLATEAERVKAAVTKDVETAMEGKGSEISTPVAVTVDTKNLEVATTNVETAFSTMQEIAEAATLTLTIDAETPIAKAIRTVRAGISVLKNMMNFRWKLPDLKVPHFSLSGAFDLQAGTVPQVDVKWYARAMRNGMILDDPTIFGMDGGKLLGAGEAGPEAVVGVSSLQDMVWEAAQNAVGGMVSALITELRAIHDDMPTGDIVMDTGALVGSTVKSMDMALNDVAKWRGRGRA